MDTRNGSDTPKFRGKSTKRGERRRAAAPKNPDQHVARKIVYEKAPVEEPVTMGTRRQVERLQKKRGLVKAENEPRRKTRREKMKLNRQMADENAEEASEAKERS